MVSKCSYILLGKGLQLELQRLLCRHHLTADSASRMSSFFPPFPSPQLPSAEAPLAWNGTRGILYSCEGLLTPACGL